MMTWERLPLGFPFRRGARLEHRRGRLTRLVSKHTLNGESGSPRTCLFRRETDLRAPLRATGGCDFRMSCGLRLTASRSLGAMPVGKPDGVQLREVGLSERVPASRGVRPRCRSQRKCDGSDKSRRQQSKRA
jgi:hypothetical protein